ncbi:MAG TPA: YggS family pyridoxal phosphate enzyme [Solirubrobacterales bacterium]|nr:YggS family pyridoxal phosphate enzyme [Solirubrobacterales bacterium]
MPELIHGIDPDEVRRRLDSVREEAGEGVRVLVATKYLPDDELPALADAGVDLVGENRLSELERKHERFGELFEWHFIGGLQSRKVKGILPLVSLIHSVGSESALEQLNKRGDAGTRILIQVNVAGEDAKEGIEPEELGDFIARSEVEVAGLATMPPFAENPEDSRRHFARLAELASEHGLGELSMGTSQDWRVAVSEGATIIRLGSVLLRGDSGHNP